MTQAVPRVPSVEIMGCRVDNLTMDETVEVVGRLVSSKLAEANGWTLLPDNKPGAGTALGLAEAVRSNNAGYDLVVAQTDNVTLIPLLMKVAVDRYLAPALVVERYHRRRSLVCRQDCLIRLT